MPEVIRLYIKTSATAFSDPQSAPTRVEGLFYSPDWSDGQERQLDSDIYWALRDYDITTYRIYVNHEFQHDLGATGLEAWEVVLHIGEGVAGALIVKDVLPRLIRIFKPRIPLEAAEALGEAATKPVSLGQARNSAVEYLKSYPISDEVIGQRRFKETLATGFENDYYLFNFDVGESSYIVVVEKNGGQVVSSVLVKPEVDED